MRVTVLVSVLPNLAQCGWISSQPDRTGGPTLLPTMTGHFNYVCIKRDSTLVRCPGAGITRSGPHCSDAYIAVSCCSNDGPEGAATSCWGGHIYSYEFYDNPLSWASVVGKTIILLL